MLKRATIKSISVSLVALLLMASRLDNCILDTEQICLTAADVSAQSARRCGSPKAYEKLVEDYIKAVAYGDCKTVKGLRDASAFVNECLPWYFNASCDLLDTHTILPACREQFLVGG